MKTVATHNERNYNEAVNALAAAAVCIVMSLEDPDRDEPGQDVVDKILCILGRHNQGDVYLAGEAREIAIRAAKYLLRELERI